MIVDNLTLIYFTTLLKKLGFSLESVLTRWLIFQMLLTTIFITGAPDWVPVLLHGYAIANVHARLPWKRNNSSGF